jgi:GNAT superfamily N-acetyltransferase
MAPEHTADAAAIHIEGQPHTFLSSLGQRFVSTLFRLVTLSPYGFGFVALAQQEVVGFVVGTESNELLFKDVLRRGPMSLGCNVLMAVLRHPSILPKLWATWRYPDQAQELPNEAESLSRGVRKDWRGKGVGSLLWNAVAREAGKRGAEYIITTVDEAHDVINAWHRAHQHPLVRSIVMYGRTMHVYRIPLTTTPGREETDA